VIKDNRDNSDNRKVVIELPKKELVTQEYNVNNQNNYQNNNIAKENQIPQYPNYSQYSQNSQYPQYKNSDHSITKPNKNIYKSVNELNAYNCPLTEINSKHSPCCM